MYFKQIDEILAGSKCQTRRVYKLGEYAVDENDFTAVAYDGSRDMAETIHSVYTPGDRLKWQVNRDYAVSPGRGKPALWWRPPSPDDIYESAYCVGKPDNDDPHWMPLRIRTTRIGYERLQDISEADAKAEGVASVAEYRGLWERINGAGSWDRNVLVWVLEFALVQ